MPTLITLVKIITGWPLAILKQSFYMTNQQEKEKPINAGFKCQQCGSCCRQVGKLIEHLPLVYGALFATDKDGACRFLKKVADGKTECAIYNMRPPICDVQWVAKHKHKALGLTDQAFIEMTEAACEILRSVNSEA